MLFLCVAYLVLYIIIIVYQRDARDNACATAWVVSHELVFIIKLAMFVL